MDVEPVVPLIAAVSLPRNFVHYVTVSLTSIMAVTVTGVRVLRPPSSRRSGRGAREQACARFASIRELHQLVPPQLLHDLTPWSEWCR